MDTALALSPAVDTSRHGALIERWKCDVAGTYQSWFLWEERLKNFRSIRRGLQVVVQEIRDNRFGNAYRGSSLEAVVHSIAEQRQIFKGADHAFLWKSKLRIPDIYEHRDNQIAGLLFDIGAGRYVPPPAGDGRTGWQEALAQVRAQYMARVKSLAMAQENDHTHTEIQGWLRDLGKAMGYDVWVASNDKNRLYLGARLSEGCLAQLPDAIRSSEAVDTVSLIDILWISKDTGKIVAAFEVEHSTSIYSGIVSMLDLALGVPDHEGAAFFLVAPDVREQDVRAQFARPAFSRVSTLDVRYLGYSQLRQRKESIARVGSGLKGMVAISACLSCQINGMN